MLSLREQPGRGSIEAAGARASMISSFAMCASDIVEAQLDAFNAANPDVTAEDLEKEPSLFKPYNSVAGFNEDDDHKDPNFSLSYTYLDGKRTVSETVTTLARGTLIKSYDMHIEVMRALGIADKSTPQSIKIYPTSFDNKAVIEEFLSGYGKETGDNIKYTDQLAIIMSFVEQMSSTVIKSVNCARKRRTGPRFFLRRSSFLPNRLRRAEASSSDRPRSSVCRAASASSAVMET